MEEGTNVETAKDLERCPVMMARKKIAENAAAMEISSAQIATEKAISNVKNVAVVEQLHAGIAKEMEMSIVRNVTSLIFDRFFDL